MKKSILVLLAIAFALPTMAQTDFRHITYDEAVAAAKAENKMVFLDFYTDWCGPCKMMLKNVFPLKEVGDYLNEKFVCIKVNAEKEGKALAEKHQITAYPTFIGLDANENVVMTKVGGDFNGDNFINSIDLLVNPENKPEKLKARYDGGERNAKLVKAYAGMLQEEAKNDRRGGQAKIKQANEAVADYFNKLSAAERLKDENSFIYTVYTQSFADEAAKFMVGNHDKFSAATRPGIEKHIEELVSQQTCSFMMQQTYQRGAEYQFDTQAYAELKNTVKQMGIDADYTTAFKVIDAQQKGDAQAFLNVLMQEYNNLKGSQNVWILFNLRGLLGKQASAETKLQAAKFIRKQFEYLDGNSITFIASQLDSLEGNRTSH